MSENHVDFVLSFGQLVSVGDTFALRDVDGGEPTGEYEITHIRVDTHYNISYVTGGKVPFKRVYFGTELNGRTCYTRDVNCVVTPREWEFVKDVLEFEQEPWDIGGE